MQKNLSDLSTIPFLKIILAAPKDKNGTLKKITVRPITIGKKPVFQAEKLTKTQAFHHNLSPRDLTAYLETESAPFSEIYVLFKTCEWQGTLKQTAFSYKERCSVTARPATTDHNRTKETVLKTEIAIPPLVELGIMDKNGTVFKNKQDKFIQINRFLDVLTQAVQALPKNKKWVIWDLCCGKSYLSFILYYFFETVLKQDFKLLGVDLKADVIHDCQRLKKSLGYHKATFLAGDITTLPETTQKPDIVVSLHACDIATDIVLKQAVKQGAEVILAVPCCHKEIAPQVDFGPVRFITRHGLLKERLAALATDAIRAAWLENNGYKTDVFEFIDFENSPKNVMIRAIKSGHQTTHDLSRLCAEWHISPSILKK